MLTNACGLSSILMLNGWCWPNLEIRQDHSSCPCAAWQRLWWFKDLAGGYSCRSVRKWARSKQHSRHASV
eukprot:6206454-Amphidinium_carterae.1